MTPVPMPQVGENLETGTIVEWLKAEGDPVEKGEVLLTVESEKAVFEVEAGASGMLLEIVHRAGAEVEVFGPLGYIGEPGEKRSGGEDTKSAGRAPARSEPTRAAPSGGGAPTAAEPGAQAPGVPPDEPSGGEILVPRPRSRPFASPSARRLARELDIDLAQLEGSGPGGRIVKRDIASAADDGGDRVEPFSRARRRIAERMTLSKQTVPHFYLSADVDMTSLLVWRRAFNQWEGAEVSITDLLIRTVARTLARFKRLNAHVQADRMILKKRIHIGVATAVEDGLLVPVVEDADRMRLSEISQIRRDVTEAARRGALKPGPAGTFTITNLGAGGVTRFLPIIQPPECAILGAGSVAERVVSVDRAPAVRDMMTLTLACDHRGVDGAYAAGFLDQLKRALEQPDGGD